MITKTFTFAIARDSESNDRAAIMRLYAVPSGSRVILEVGAREYVPTWTVDHLRQYVETLHIDVHGDVAAVLAWTAALLGQDPAGVL